MLRVRSIADAARRSGWNPLLVARWAVVSSRAVHHGRSRDIGPSRQRLVPHFVCLAAGRARVAVSVEMPRDKQALAVRPYVGKSTPQWIHDSLVVADGEESPGKYQYCSLKWWWRGLSSLLSRDSSRLFF